MRHARLTWMGAFHHVMNRGLGGEAIFQTPELKKIYLNILKNQSKLNHIRVFAYCLMDTHFHLILENSSGRLSEFMKKVNSLYGFIYRRRLGGRGYVFHDRFKSTLVENDAYLQTAIVYVLLNPVRAGLVTDPFAYPWSSANLYFKRKKHDWLGIDFIEGLFGSKTGLSLGIKNFLPEQYKERKCKYGLFFGSKQFIDQAEWGYDRRRMEKTDKNQRMADKYFEPVEKVFFEFEKKIGRKIEEIDTSQFAGKRLRGELLVYLRDLCGLKYSQIAEFDFFRDLKFNSLGNLYGAAKKKLHVKN